ncbi:AMP-binding protein [Odoribacter lunatus]|uniref:AMP-binding protein n=1 Tax=Odoribacter lunatus TaxID=2941335 RepID=UPI00203CB07C|nr:AMP-binding protein [Odoribacter lunatus]
MEQSFIALLEDSIKKHWDLSSLTDYNGISYTYKDVAVKIEKLHLLFEHSGIKKGDKIGLCSRNCSHWAIAFLAALTYKAIAVPILHEFKSDNIHHIINHSEARLLFVGDGNWATLDHQHMPTLESIIRMEDFTIRHTKKAELITAREKINELFEQKFSTHFTWQNIRYPRENPEDTALINYTSGTTSASKGVILPYRSMWSNLRFALDKMGYHPGDRLIAILTMAHMYGLAFEFIYPFASGSQIYFLNKTPSPRIISEAFTRIRPHLIVAVPLIIEKIIRKRVLPQINRPHIKLLLKLPYIHKKIKARIRQKVLDAFGGRFKLFAVGGAALNLEIETFLASIRFPFTVGYGMTECGPGISFDNWQTFRLGSCGKAIDRIEIRIDSPDPQNTVGEIMVKGTNLMKGYYKNIQATQNAFTADGWLHTGDLGILDSDGYLYIKGRSKNMILGPSGQNIYPEEIEDRLNTMPYVSESLVIEHDGKLIALIYPDLEAAQNARITQESLAKQLDHNRKQLNEHLPAYSQITRIRIRQQEFEKTPKKSIKRYLYQK